MGRTLRFLVVAMGVACVGIGLVHLVFGIASVPGEGTASATVDSRERFYGAIFFGYGVAWLLAARQRPIPSAAVRWLAAVFFLGGVGRVVSLIQHGRPQWLQLVLTAIEVALPPLYLWLATADERGSFPTDDAGGWVVDSERRHASRRQNHDPDHHPQQRR